MFDFESNLSFSLTLTLGDMLMFFTHLSRCSSTESVTVHVVITNWKFFQSFELVEKRLLSEMTERIPGFVGGRREADPVGLF